MLRPLVPDDLPACLELWCKTVPAKYQIAFDTLAPKLFGHPNFLSDYSFVAVQESCIVGFLAVKQNPVGTLYSLANHNRIHINSLAFESKEIAHTLLNALESQCKQPLVFGQDNGHIFPGVPEEWTDLNSVLKERGYSREDIWINDLERSLRDFEFEYSLPDGYEIRRTTQEDFPSLDQFFSSEFPGRWHYDTVTYKINWQNEPSDIFILLTEDQIKGFAYTQSFATTKIPIAGCVWTPSLGKCWGGLGPIGISRDIRGQNLGAALLIASLLELKSNGVQQCIIDWTSLVDFYGKYGFQVTRRYKRYQLDR